MRRLAGGARAGPLPAHVANCRTSRPTPEPTGAEMSNPVRIAIIVVLAALLWYLVITFARGVS